MFKLIVIVVVVFLVWKKLNVKNQQIVKDKMNQLKNADINAPAALTTVKEKSRGILIQLIVLIIGLLTGILKMLIGSTNSNLPTIRR